MKLSTYKLLAVLGLFAFGILCSLSYGIDINWLYSKGITKYSQIETFRQHDLISRGAASKFMIEYGKSLNLLSSVGLNDCYFNDINTYDYTLVPYIKQACEAGIFKGSNGKFFPENFLTKAEALTIILRIFYGVQIEDGSLWYENYYYLGQQEGLTINGSLDSIGSEYISRGEFGERLIFLGKKHESKDFSVVGFDTLSSRERFQNVSDKYIINVKPSVIAGIPKNLAVQTRIKKGECLEIIEGVFPTSFARVSKDGVQRKSLSSHIRSEGLTDSYYPYICGEIYVRVEYPKNIDILSGSVPFSFKAVDNTRGANFCHTFTVLTDNGDYHEESECFDDGTYNKIGAELGLVHSMRKYGEYVENVFYDDPATHLAGVKLSPQVFYGEPENLILQIELPSGLCTYTQNNNVPYGFTYVRKTGSTDRKTFNKSPYVSSVKSSIYRPDRRKVCGPVDIKVEYPKNRKIFEDGVTFQLYVEGDYKIDEGRRSSLPLYSGKCIDVLVSSDNSQYVEEKICL